MDIKQEGFQSYFDKLTYINNPMALTLTIHLYTEYWIDKLLEKFSPIGNNIINDRNYTFAIKLSIVYSMNLIPKQLYENIKKLNKLRNAFAHDLDFDIEKADFNYFLEDGTNLNSMIKKEELWRKFMFIGISTFEWLATLTYEKITKEKTATK